MGVTTRWACWRSWPAMKHLSNATGTSLPRPTVARHCYRDYGVRNAQDMIRLLTSENTSS